MNKLPLSALQLKLYKEVKEQLNKTDSMILYPKKDGRYKYILELMVESGCVEYMKTMMGDTYIKRDDLNFFEEWLMDRQREEKKFTAREWKIALVGAFIGLIPFITTTIIPWIIKLFAE